MNAIAMWHYPHRNAIENARFFANKGLKALSLNQSQLITECKTDGGKELAQTLREENITLTIHGLMAQSHEKKYVDDYKERINLIAKWQEEYNLISVLSFDVYDSIRDNVSIYIDYALDSVKNCYIAVEDFGLTSSEKSQIEYLKGNNRFGYLLDIGHMYMRLCGNSKEDATLFKNSVEECEACKNPTKEYFLKAIRSKEFPIVEIHLHNNDGVHDLHYFLKDGTLDIKMIADVLRELNYKGIITIESAPGFRFECKYPESDIRILEDVEYWEKIYTK